MTRRIHAEAPARLHILLIASVAMVWWMNGWTLAAVLTGLCVFLPLLLRDRKTSSAPILCQPSQEAVPVEVACFWVRPDPADFGVEVRIARIWTDCGDGSNVPAAYRTEHSAHPNRPSASTSGRRTKRHQPSARTATRRGQAEPLGGTSAPRLLDGTAACQRDSPADGRADVLASAESANEG